MSQPLPLLPIRSRHVVVFCPCFHFDGRKEASWAASQKVLGSRPKRHVGCRYHCPGAQSDAAGSASLGPAWQWHLRLPVFSVPGTLQPWGTEMLLKCCLSQLCNPHSYEHFALLCLKFVPDSISKASSAFPRCPTTRWQAEVQNPCPKTSTDREEVPRDRPWQRSLKLVQVVLPPAVLLGSCSQSKATEGSRHLWSVPSSQLSF